MTTPAAQVYALLLKQTSAALSVPGDLVDSVVEAGNRRQSLDAGSQIVYDFYTRLASAPSTVRPMCPDAQSRDYDPQWQSKTRVKEWRDGG